MDVGIPDYFPPFCDLGADISIEPLGPGAALAIAMTSWAVSRLLLNQPQQKIISVTMPAGGLRLSGATYRRGVAGAPAGAAGDGVGIFRSVVPDTGPGRLAPIEAPSGKRRARAAPTLAASGAAAGCRAASARWRAAIASISLAGWSAKSRPGIGAQS